MATTLNTHGVVIERDRVTKTYTSWDRAEHRREWAALRHLHRHAPARRFTDSARPADPLVAAAYDAACAWWHGPDPGLLATAPPDPVLGHRDPNLNNYLWDGTRVHIVDFEDAALSDPSTELALLVEHLSTRALDSDALCAAFPVDPARLRAARRAFAMFWMWLLRPGGPAARRNPPDTDRAQARRLLDLLNTD